MSARWQEIRDGAVVYEDHAVLVLNKPGGISVMGERHDTDLVRLAQEAGEKLIPVHRIDKATSGAILFAKELRFHSDLTRQFNRRTVDKFYLAVTRSTGLPEHGTIELPLSVGRKNRVRVAANRGDIVRDETGHRWSVPETAEFGHTRTYPSVTAFARVGGDADHTLLVVRPVTGRRHQIRVHLAWIGHPVHGDPLFDKNAGGSRTYLHSWRLSFAAAWSGGERIDAVAPPGPDFWAPLAESFPETDREATLERARRVAQRSAAHADLGKTDVD